MDEWRILSQLVIVDDKDAWFNSDSAVKGSHMRRRKDKAEMSGTYGTELRPMVKLRMAKQGIFFGPGTAQLLENIDALGSIQEACAQMELSYSKGSRIIKNTEKELGFALLERWSGGASGGGSRLTQEGRRFLDAYKALSVKVQQSAEELFAECFEVRETEDSGGYQ